MNSRTEQAVHDALIDVVKDCGGVIKEDVIESYTSDIVQQIEDEIDFARSEDEEIGRDMQDTLEKFGKIMNELGLTSIESFNSLSAQDVREIVSVYVRKLELWLQAKGHIK